MDDKNDLLEKAANYLNLDLDTGDSCCKELISNWVGSVQEIKASPPSECCLSSMKSLIHFFIEELFESKYIVTKNAMFGDLFEIRNLGFENRYLSNTKLCRTYKAAYEKTELEYKTTFKKRRYSSYDSFRQIRSRKLKGNKG